jgi:hypothetical protein
MAKTFLGKMIDDTVNKVSKKMSDPLDNLRRINAELKKSQRVGSLTDAELAEIKIESERYGKRLMDVNTKDIRNSIRNIKSSLTSVKSGQDIALGSMVGTSGPLGPQVKVNEEASKLIEDGAESVERAGGAMNNIQNVVSEGVTMSTENAQMIKAGFTHNEGRPTEEEKMLEKKWNEYVNAGTADIFYTQGNTPLANAWRDFVHQDPKRYAIVLEHAAARGQWSIDAIKGIGVKKDPWLDTRVKTEVEMNNIMVEYILKKDQRNELKILEMERLKKMWPNGLMGDPLKPRSEFNKLIKIGESIEEEVSKILQDIKKLKMDYTKNASVLTSLAKNIPAQVRKNEYLKVDLDTSGFTGGFSGKITQHEYNAEISERHRQLLDESVGATINVAYDSVQIQSAQMDSMENVSEIETGILVDMTDDSADFSVHAIIGYEVKWQLTQEVKTLEGTTFEEIYVIQNRYGTEIFLEENKS